MENNSQNISAYKAAYKRHRRRPLDPTFIEDLEELVDFCKTSSDPRIVDLNSKVDGKIHGGNSSATDDFSYRGPRYGLNSHPGFIYIPQALGKNIQNDLAYQALTEFLNPPHATNIDLVPIKENELENGTLSMWELWKKSLGCDDDAHFGNEQSMKSSFHKLRKQSAKSGNQANLHFYKSFDKLSWATTGYHYDWTARAYVEERKSPMPKELVRLGSIFASLDPSLKSTCTEQNVQTTGIPSIPSTQPQHDSFNTSTSASIINYYSLKSNMGGHRDDLELDFTKPVVSLSLGLPAVFLLGNKTKDDPVVPILVRPGDVMLLAGESRLCYHGMARVIPAEVPVPVAGPKIDGVNVKEFQIQSWESINNGEFSFGKELCIPKSELEPAERFLSKHRININVRQVLPHGITKIPKNPASMPDNIHTNV